MRGEFIEYVKLVENGGKVGFDGETWFPHPSPEGGNDTIAYGHKLKNDETWMKVGISDSDAENLYQTCKLQPKAQAMSYQNLAAMTLRH